MREVLERVTERDLREWAAHFEHVKDLERQAYEKAKHKR